MVPYALVLFDYDGCTAIVDTKKLVLEGGNLVNGQQCHMRLHGENLAVEILQLSDSKGDLNEDEWSLSHRSIALDREKKRRRNRRNGYLSVLKNDLDDEPLNAGACNTKVPSQRGRKGRKTTVHQTQQYQQGKRSVGTQTEAVIIFGPDDVIPSLQSHLI